MQGLLTTGHLVQVDIRAARPHVRLKGLVQAPSLLPERNERQDGFRLDARVGICARQAVDDGAHRRLRCAPCNATSPWLSSDNAMARCGPCSC